jgi:hypothetical protein
MWPSRLFIPIAGSVYRDVHQAVAGLLPTVQATAYCYTPDWRSDDSWWQHCNSIE